MSNPLIVTIPDSIGKEQALRWLKSGMARVLGNVPILHFDEQTWSGDRMSFRVRALGQATSGTIDVGEDNVRVEISLPLLLQKFAQIVQRGMTEGTRRLLEKK